MVSSAVALIDCEFAHRAACAVEETHSDLPGTPGADPLLEAHSPQHLPASATDVDVLSAIPQGGSAFDDGRRVSVPKQPVGKGRARDPGAADQYGSRGNTPP